MVFGRSEQKKKSWEHPQFKVSLADQYPDEACKTLDYELIDLPGVAGVDSLGSPELSFYHHFQITLPREYPQNLAQIKIINKTPLYHPRIAGVGGKACYTVNGEVDRILTDIVFNVLMRPETVRPPGQYKDADWGLDSSKMKWYIKYGPEKLYTLLKEEWGKKQNQQEVRKKVQFMD